VRLHFALPGSFDYRENPAKGIGIGTATPLKDDDFGGGDQRPGLAEQLEGEIAVGGDPGGHGIGNQMNLKTSLEQIKAGLQYANMGFHAHNHKLRACKGTHHSQEGGFQTGTEMLLVKHRGSGVNLFENFGKSRAETFAVLFGEDDGNLKDLADLVSWPILPAISSQDGMALSIFC
jgi:hypothetical protein